MAGNTGSFGLLKPHYLITPERVTIKRNVMLPFLLVTLGAVGGWWFAQGMGKHGNDSLLAPGFIMIMAGVFALVMTPWTLPGEITVTREGVVWGGVKYPAQTIIAVRAYSTEVRAARYGGGYLSWKLLITTTTKKALSLSLGNRQLSASTEPLVTLHRAMNAVLGRQAA